MDTHTTSEDETSIGRVNPAPSPVTEVVMLTVFLGLGIVVTSTHEFGQSGMVPLFVGLLVTTVTVEVVHEQIHRWIFRLLGFQGTIEWRSLAVIPYEQKVPIPAVLCALIAPFLVISGLALAGAVVIQNQLLTSALLYAVVLNTALSSIDFLSGVQLLRHPPGSVLFVEKTADGNVRMSVIPPE